MAATNERTPDDKLIAPIANTFARSYGLDADDIAQELRLWWLRNMTYVERYFGDGEVGMKKLYTALKRAAHSYCVEQLSWYGPPDDSTSADHEEGPGTRFAVPNIVAIALTRDYD